MTALLVVGLVTIVLLLLFRGWVQPAGHTMRAWSPTLLFLHVMIALVLAIVFAGIALAVVRGDWRAALIMLIVILVVGLIGLIFFREPLGDWWRALREAGSSQAGTIRRLPDHEIGPFARRAMDRRKGFVYLGREVGPTHRWVCAEPEHAVLVLGPPRQGKTTAVVIPTILAASGPVVVTSTKEDVMRATSNTRSQVGTSWLFDPSGTVAPPPTIRLLRWSPIEGCATWDGAVMIAHNIVATSRPSEGVRDAGHWAERSEALLAPVLHAAALDGLAMRQVMTWVLSQDGESPQAILDRRRAGLASATLAGVGRSSQNERAGIWSTAAGALAAYRSQAALAATDSPNFDPQLFVHSRDSVYITAPAVHQRVTAPLIVALLEEIRSAAYIRAAQHARNDKLHQRPVLWLLDEVANIAPLPELPSIVSEGGGQGLVVLACLQDLSQARERWGDRAEGFLSLFGTKLILRGLGDMRTLQAISSLAGEHEVRKVSETKPSRHLFVKNSTQRSKTYTKQRESRLPVDKVAEGEKGKALLFQTGRPWTWVRLTFCWESQPWKALVGATERQSR